MDQGSPIAVALEDATVAFALGDGRVYTAVEKASLNVAQGEFVAIVGPTGCGKSTLLNVAAGLLKPAGGSARIFGMASTGGPGTCTTPSVAKLSVIECAMVKAVMVHSKTRPSRTIRMRASTNSR